MTRLRASEHPHALPEGVPEGSVLTVFRVPPEVAGMRVDVFLQSQLRRTSRTRAQFIVRASAYDAEGRRMRPGERVRADQLVLLWRAPWDEAAVPTEIPVLHQDPHLLAVDKPAFLPVHPTARYHKNTLIKLLQAERPGEFLSLGHRIDRETSGVLLVARSPECDRKLKRALEARAGIHKEYVAITWGVPGGARRDLRVDLPLELDPESPYKVKMRVGKTARALEASTIFHVEATATCGERAYARVRCELLTGRQHQIRVHLAALGTPIVGDKLYGPDDAIFARGADDALTEDDLRVLELPRHALHAASMSLSHPVTGAPLRIDAPLPADLLTFWNTLSTGGPGDLP